MKKKIAVFLIVILAVFATAFLAGIKYTSRNGNGSDKQNIASNENPVLNSENTDIPSSISDNEKNIPLGRARERVTKKPFGIFITSQNSPVQPERFRGYHTGTDFEILPGEELINVPVRAVCSGKLRAKQYVNGYDGVAVQDCRIQSENVTVSYGHLSLLSIRYEAGDKMLEMGEIGNLGDPAKGETDGERKHLHLGIHKGNNIDFRGYVNSQNELSSWIDPCLYFCK